MCIWRMMISNPCKWSFMDTSGATGIGLEVNKNLPDTPIITSQLKAVYLLSDIINKRRGEVI